MSAPSAFQSDANGSQSTRPAPTRSPSHYISVAAAQKRYRDAGFPRTDKAIQRYCKNGTLTMFEEIGPNGRPKFFIEPASIDQHLKQLAQLHHLDGGGIDSADASRTEANGLERSTPSYAEIEPPRARTIETTGEQSRPVANDIVERRSSASTDGPVDHADHSRPSPTPEPAVPSTSDKGGRPNADVDRLVYEHPYVKRLERDYEELKQNYREQVKRTEDIQTAAFDRLVELQRSSQIAQSQTLADFFIKTRDYLLGRGGKDAEDQSQR